MAGLALVNGRFEALDLPASGRFVPSVAKLLAAADLPARESPFRMAALQVADNYS